LIGASNAPAAFTIHEIEVDVSDNSADKSLVEMFGFSLTLKFTSRVRGVLPGRLRWRESRPSPDGAFTIVTLIWGEVRQV